MEVKRICQWCGKPFIAPCRYPFAGVSEQHSLQERAWADILLNAPLRPLEEFRTGEQGGILHRQGGNGEIQALS